MTFGPIPVAQMPGLFAFTETLQEVRASRQAQWRWSPANMDHERFQENSQFECRATVEII